MNISFYEAVARERIHDIERQAELRRLIASGKEPRPGRLRQWRQRLHLARRPQQPRPVAAREADGAGLFVGHGEAVVTSHHA
jgi:hypothetical protein